jgi:hypothetical protein
MTEVETKEEQAVRIAGTLLDIAPSKVFEFVKIQPDGKRANVPVRVQMLRVEEDHQVLESAQLYARSRKESPKDYGDLYREGQAVALLTKALRKVEKRERNDGTFYYPPLFTSEEQLRQSFTAPEMAQCLNMYELVRSEFGAVESFSDGDFEKWVDQLGDPLRGPFALQLLDSAHWANVLLRLAQEARLLRLSSLSSSESDQGSSGPDTGSFTQLPAAFADSGAALPTDHLLTKQEASEMAERIYKKKE